MRLFATLLMGFCLLAAQAGPVWAACIAQQAGKSIEKSMDMPCHAAGPVVRAMAKPAGGKSLPLSGMPCCGDKCHCLQGLAAVMPLSLPPVPQTPAEVLAVIVQPAFRSIVPSIPTSPPKAPAA